jgi:phage terminase large subunit
MDECRLQVFGLDFGFTNDPTALEEVRLAHGDLWIDEHIYETGLVNVDHRHAEANIVDRMAAAGITGRLMIVADSAEQKSIREIHNEGYWIVPSVKGQGSVLHGLDILRRYRIHFTRRSAGAIAEAKSYMWAKDREGNTVNKPVDKMNHAIDAIRYAVQMKLGQPQARGVTRRN